MIGREAVDRGIEGEAVVMARLRAAGWGVVVNGQGAWNPKESPGGDAVLLDAVRRSRSPARWLADLLAGSHRGITLVEVIRCDRDNLALEQAKLEANDLWALVLAVWYVNAADWQVWPHRGWDWDGEAVSGLMRHHHGNGSGDPYRLFRRAGIGRPFHEVFGGSPTWP